MNVGEKLVWLVEDIFTSRVLENKWIKWNKNTIVYTDGRIIKFEKEKVNTFSLV